MFGKQASNGGYIENLATGEKMEVRVVNDVYVFDVEMDDTTIDVITLDSGAGVSVSARGLAVAIILCRARSWRGRRTIPIGPCGATPSWATRGRGSLVPRWVCS